MATISQAIQDAVDNCNTKKGRQFQDIKFSAAWVGMAGYDRPSLASSIDRSLSELIDLPVGAKLKITTDIDLLPTTVQNQTDVDNAIVVVAGTGSIAMSYAKVDGQFQRTHRVGGWGHLLGDDGSGYGIGREALRKALYSSDLYRMGVASDVQMSPLSLAIFEHFQALYPTSKAEDLLSTVLLPQPGGEDTASTSTIKRVAGVAKLVLSLAETDGEAKRIVDSGVSSLTDLVSLLVGKQGFDTSRTALVLAGGMMQDAFYRDTLVKSLEARCNRFGHTEAVTQPALAGARWLLSQI
jgi:N-acetylmuramic acid 6-phosphate etherase